MTRSTDRMRTAIALVRAHAWADDLATAALITRMPRGDEWEVLAAMVQLVVDAHALGGEGDLDAFLDDRLTELADIERTHA